MRLENRIGFFMPVKSARKIKNGDALNARRFINHEFTAPDFGKTGDCHVHRHIPAFRGNIGVQLLLDESIVCPKTLRIAIGGIHEFDIVADHANHAET